MNRKNKIKKTTMKVFLVVLTICLIMPWVSGAVFLKDFLADMKSNPSNYYIWHTRTEANIVSRINEFASQFGVQVSSTEIPGKKFLIITFEDSLFGMEYVTPGPISYASVDVTDGKFIKMYVGVDDIYLDQGNINLDEVFYNYLDKLLGNLETYSSWTDEFKIVVKAAEGQIFEDRMPTCSELGNYDRSVWYKDEFIHQAEVWSDLCNGNILSELTCSGDDVIFEKWSCPRGCSNGRCIYNLFFLIYEYDKNDILFCNFADSLDAWLNI